MAQDTRKGKRAPAALRVRFRAGSVEEFIEQQSPNISSGGMFIKSKSPLARGTLMVFDFQLQDGSPLIKGVGRVVWARKPETAGNEPPGMGIKFIRVEPESLPTFQRIMAGKRPSEAPKDVVVKLGEATSDEGAAPTPSDGKATAPAPDAAKREGPKKAVPKKPGEPWKPSASSKPAEPGSPGASPKPAGSPKPPSPSKAARSPKPPDPLKAARSPKPPSPSKAARSPKPLEPSKAARSPKPLEPSKAARSPKPPSPSKAAQSPKPADSSKPAPPARPEKTPLDAVDLRVTPRYDRGPPDRLQSAKKTPDTLSDDDQTPIPTGAEEEAAAATPAETTTPQSTQLGGELSRPIKVLQGDDESLSPPSVPRAEVPKPVDDSPKKTQIGTPIADMLDSSKPAEPGADGRSPAGASPRPMEVESRGPVPKPASRPIDEPDEEKGSKVGTWIIAVVLILVLGGGGYAIYAFDLFGAGEGGSAGGTSPTPPGDLGSGTGDASTAPTPASDAAVVVTPIDSGPAAGDAGPSQAGDAASPLDQATRGRTLVVTSDPERSPVSFNGRPIGRTPQTITSADVSLDRPFTLSLTRRRHQNWSETIEPDDPRWGQTGGEQRLELHVELVRRERVPTRPRPPDRPRQTDSGPGEGGGQRDSGPGSSGPEPPTSGQDTSEDSSSGGDPPPDTPPETPPPTDVSDNPY